MCLIIIMTTAAAIMTAISRSSGNDSDRGGSETGYLKGQVAWPLLLRQAAEFSICLGHSVAAIIAYSCFEEQNGGEMKAHTYPLEIPVQGHE